MKFDDYIYYPVLRTREAEIRALQRLQSSDKTKLLPIITLGKWRNDDEGLESSLKGLADAINDRPIILDVTTESLHHGPMTREFKKPANYFAAWRAFIRKKLFNAIPAVQLVEEATQRDITQQALRLEKEHGRIAFRVRNFSTDLPKVIGAMSALDDTENALVIFDVGYIRYVNTNNITQGLVQGVIQAINELREAIPESYVCLTSTSFPRTVTPFSDKAGKKGEIGILEHELYLSAAGPESDIFYGDHGSVHSVVYPDSGGRYIPRIDLPQSESWVFERRPGAGAKGYSDAAQALLEKYSEIQDEADSSWGITQIIASAEGRTENLQTPSRWIAVRVNIHMHRQLRWLSEGVITEEGGPDE